MPKLKPGMTCEFAIITEDGTESEIGTVKGPKGALPMLAMRAIRKRIAKLNVKDDHEPTSRA